MNESTPQFAYAEWETTIKKQKKHCGVCEVLEVDQILVMLGMCSTTELHAQSLQCPWLKMRVRAVDGIPWAPLLFITHLCGSRPRAARVCRTSTAPAVSWGSQTGNSSAIVWPLPDRRSEQALLRMVVSVALFTGMSLWFRLGGSVSWVFSEGMFSPEVGARTVPGWHG